MRQLIASTTKLVICAPIRGFDIDEQPLRLRVPGPHMGPSVEVPVGDRAQRQIAEHCGVPWSFYRRLRVEAPMLLAFVLNFLLHQKPTERLVQIDGDEIVSFTSPKRTTPAHVARPAE